MEKRLQLDAYALRDAHCSGEMQSLIWILSEKMWQMPSRRQCLQKTILSFRSCAATNFAFAPEVKSSTCSHQMPKVNLM